MTAPAPSEPCWSLLHWGAHRCPLWTIFMLPMCHKLLVWRGGRGALCLLCPWEIENPLNLWCLTGLQQITAKRHNREHMSMTKCFLVVENIRKAMWKWKCAFVPNIIKMINRIFYTYILKKVIDKNIQLMWPAKNETFPHPLHSRVIIL